MPLEINNLFGLLPGELPAIGSLRPHNIHSNESPCRCHNCDSTIEREDGIELDGELHCPDCVCVCEECSAPHLSDSGEIHECSNWQHGSRVSSQILCEDCSFRCADCCEWFANSCENYSNHHDDRICPNCDEDYYSCDDCGCTMHVDDAISNDTGTYCESCYRDDEDENASIHSYSFKPRPSFYYLPDEKGNRRYFGIEIETEANGNGDLGSNAESVSHSGLFYCKEDSSIQRGFEMVSHPATIAYWRTADLAAIGALKDAGYRSYNTSTCGMHVHVSKATIGPLVQYKLLKFFKDNVDTIVRVSRRRRENLDRWSRVETTAGTATMVRKVKSGNTHDNRYVALNFESDQTVEFRIFRGTLDVAAIKRNIEWVNAIIEFCRTHGMEQMTAGHFATWLHVEAYATIGKPAAKLLAKWADELTPESEE